jgi:hypothetical protein
MSLPPGLMRCAAVGSNRRNDKVYENRQTSSRGFRNFLPYPSRMTSCNLCRLFSVPYIPAEAFQHNLAYIYL